LDHEDAVAVVVTVDPELCTRSAAPAVAAFAIDGAAQTVNSADLFQMVLEHQVDGIGLENAFVFSFALS
jgi:hypothetical protein